jgi:hypothetical protein
LIVTITYINNLYTSINPVVMAHKIVANELFQEACLEGKFDVIVKCIIEKELDINTIFYEENDGYSFQLWSPLRIATYKGYSNIVNFLLSCPNININAHDIYKRSSLSIACHRGNVEIFKLLLLHGATISTSMCCGIENPEIGCSISMLMEACWNGNSEIVGTLINSKLFNINEHDAYGRTALHIACQKQLLMNNSDSNDVANQELNFEYDCIILLLLCLEEIDVTLKDNKDKTAYQYYVEKEGYINDQVLETFTEELNTLIKVAENDESGKSTNPFNDDPFAEFNASVNVLETPVKYYFRQLGILDLYTDEIEEFENETGGKNVKDTFTYSILEEYVKICKSFGFGIEIRYFQYSKMIQLSCYWEENAVTYMTNGKEYKIYTPKIVFEENISFGTTASVMYLNKFTPPPQMGWGWKFASAQDVIRKKEEFFNTLGKYILLIT